MKRKLLALTVLLCMLLPLALTGCSGGDKLAYVAYGEDIKEFDTSLFYGNVETMQGADPSLIWVPEALDENGQVKEDTGYYYAYITATSTINAWRTRDMTNWQYLGAVFRPDLDTFWAYMNFWAPAVHYDAEDGVYYMYYSATSKSVSEYKTHYISLATSTSPMGPFTEWGSISEPLIDFSKMPKDHPLYEAHGEGTTWAEGYFAAIDAEPFVDVNGDIYLLFTHDKGAGYSSSSTYIMKMKEWWEPDYESITCISLTGSCEVGGTEVMDEGTVNEGPFMLYHEGLYYLTFSVHTYDESSYQVRQAVGTSPMGPFHKIATEKGGTVITTDGLNAYTNSAGHHSFITVGDELYISYHTFKNDKSISQARKIRFDKVSFVTNDDGIPVIYANGPTVTLQPLPTAISGYENKATSAQVTATGLREGSSTYWLNDGTLKIHETPDIVDETYFNVGKKASTVTLSWEDYISAKAIMVYNSNLYATSFTKIDNIRIWYRVGDTEGVCETGEIAFSYDQYSLVPKHYNCIFAGASCTIQFADMDIRQIEITVSESSGGEVFAISEITVLGKKEGR